MNMLLLMMIIMTTTTTPIMSGELICPKKESKCTMDLMTLEFYNQSIIDIVNNIRYEYEDKPIECQKGHALCHSFVTYNQYKGDVVWPLTEIGTRRAVRCPYALNDEDLYLNQDCLLNETDEARWMNFNGDRCPLPLFSRRLEEIHLFDNSTLTANQCSVLVTNLSQIVSIRKKFQSNPVFLEDLRKLLLMYGLLIGQCYEHNCRQSNDLIGWNVADVVLDKSFEILWSLEDFEKFLLSLDRLFSCFSTESFLHNSFILSAYSQLNHSGEYFEHSFQSDKGDDSLGSVTIKDNSSLTNIHLFFLRNTNIAEPIEIDPNQNPLLEELNNDNSTTPAPPPIRPRSTAPLRKYTFVKSVVFIKYAFTHEEETTKTEIEIEFNHSDYPKLEPSDLCCANAPFVTTLTNSSVAEIGENDLKVAQKLTWSSRNCRLFKFTNDTLTCRCRGVQGFFAVIQPFVTNAFGASPGKEITRQSDISLLMGFPYVEELSIAGKVLRAISLVCLVITVLSYAIFRKARKGTPTRILLNLCVSLIVLLIVLYIAEYEANTRIGCRVMNVFRYYLVLVSLLWNAVEAHNMYRMLIEVFNAEISHFVLYAGIFAWGVPAIFVAIGLTVNFKAFDGTYVNCGFRCSLRQNTLIYGWILPMSVIIAHNLIMFSIILRKVLLKTEPKVMNSKSSAKSHWSRLISAFTLLVLLGVPWVFSAFGVIDTGNSGVVLRHLEGIFHVVFIVCISLQGLFIFLFHCARSKSIRKHWHDAVKSRTSTFTTSLRDASMSTSFSEIDQRKRIVKDSLKHLRHNDAANIEIPVVKLDTVDSDHVSDKSEAAVM